MARHKISKAPVSLGGSSTGERKFGHAKFSPLGLHEPKEVMSKFGFSVKEEKPGVTIDNDEARKMENRVRHGSWKK